MTKHYRLPILLIEFDRDRAFALQVQLSLKLSPQCRPLHAIQNS